MEERYTKSLGSHARIACIDAEGRGKVKIMILQFLTPLVQMHTMVYGNALVIVG